MAAQLLEEDDVGGAARAALGDQQAGRQRGNQRRDLRDQAVADRQLDEDIRRLTEIHGMAAIADGDAAEDVDGSDDEAGDGVAADEFRSAVHGAEEGAFLFQFAAAQLGFLFGDDSGAEIGVDAHLLARNGVEGEAGADLGDAGRALGDDDEVDDDQDQEDDDTDQEVAAHDEFCEAADDMAGGVGALVSLREDHARRRDVQRQAQHGGDQQHGREGGEVERPVDPQRDEEDQDREGQRERQAHVDHEGRDRQEQDDEDHRHADRQADIGPALGQTLGRCGDQTQLLYPRNRRRKLRRQACV